MKGATVGNFAITIKGAGSHHNGSKGDVEQMTADFVDKLKDTGHTVTGADVTTGANNDLINHRGELLPIKE